MLVAKLEQREVHPEAEDELQISDGVRHAEREQRGPILVGVCDERIPQESVEGKRKEHPYHDNRRRAHYDGGRPVLPAPANAPGHRIAAEDADLHGALASRVQVALRLAPCRPSPITSMIDSTKS